MRVKKDEAKGMHKQSEKKVADRFSESMDINVCPSCVVIVELHRSSSCVVIVELNVCPSCVLIGKI